MALLGGSLLLVLACVLGCCVPAVLEPQPGGTDHIDYGAARDAWGQTFERLTWAAIALAFAAVLLLAFGFVHLRARHWRTKHIRQQRGE
jgi:ABC-type Fe3+ transport system permease subunit